MDASGRWHYSLAAFILRVSNYLATMGAYQRRIWTKVLPLLNSLLDKQGLRGISLHQEALSLPKHERTATPHVADKASKQVATANSLRRHAWLRSTTIPDDARSCIEDLPFDGVGLFDANTDKILDGLQKFRKTACSYSYQGS